MTVLACGHCGAALAFAGVRTETCPFCASPNFVERPPAPGVPDPMFVIGFVGDAAAARRAIERWLGSRSWFADAAIRRARVEDMRGIYVPAYLYSAVAHTSYRAEIGEDYRETETYTTKDEHGETKTETRTVTRTEYRPLTGTHVGYVTDVVVSASAALADHELVRTGPYDLRRMRRYQPALVVGWIAEEFSRPAEVCRRDSRARVIERVGGELYRFLPGDSYSDLSYRTEVEWESLEPVLVPAWVLAVRYRDDRPPLRVVINGQTGQVAGRAPIAWWKVAIAAALLAAIALAIAMVVR